MSLPVRLVGAPDLRFSISDRSGYLFRQARRHPRRSAHRVVRWCAAYRQS